MLTVGACGSANRAGARCAAADTHSPHARVGVVTARCGHVFECLAKRTHWQANNPLTSPLGCLLGALHVPFALAPTLPPRASLSHAADALASRQPVAGDGSWREVLPRTDLTQALGHPQLRRPTVVHHTNFTSRAFAKSTQMTASNGVLVTTVGC